MPTCHLCEEVRDEFMVLHDPPEMPRVGLTAPVHVICAACYALHTHHTGCPQCRQMYDANPNIKPRIVLQGAGAQLPGCSHAMVRGASRGQEPMYGFCGNATYEHKFCAHHGGAGAGAAAAMEVQDPVAPPAAPALVPFAMLRQNVQMAQQTTEMAQHTSSLLQASQQEHAQMQQMLHGVQATVADGVRSMRVGRDLLMRVANRLGLDSLRSLHAPPAAALPPPPPVQIQDVTEEEVDALAVQLLGL